MEAEANIPRIVSDCIVNVCQSYVTFNNNIAVSGFLKFRVDESKYFYVDVNEKLKSEITELLKESSTEVDICECGSQDILQSGHSQKTNTTVTENNQTSKNIVNKTSEQQKLPTISDLATSLSQTVSSNINLNVKQEVSDLQDDPGAKIKPEIISLSDDDGDEEETYDDSSSMQSTAPLPIYTTQTQDPLNQAQASASDTTSLLRAQAESMYQNMIQSGGAMSSQGGLQSTAQFDPTTMANVSQSFTSSPRQYTPPRQYNPRRKTPMAASRRGGMRGGIRHKTPGATKRQYPYTQSSQGASAAMGSAMAMQGMAGNGGQSDQFGADAGDSFDNKEAVQQQLATGDMSQGATPGSSGPKKKRLPGFHSLVPSKLPKDCSGVIVKFTCSHSGCDATFSRAWTLSRHVQSVHQGVRYKCHGCDKIFADNALLTKHIKVIHEGIGMKCPGCKKMFVEESNLMTHIKAYHSGI